MDTRRATRALNNLWTQYADTIEWAWKSAENYKKIKKKKKQGSGWAIAGQIYIVLATLRGVVEMIKTR